MKFFRNIILNRQTMYSSITIAHNLIKRGIDECKPIDQMQLQKMLYFAQGYNLVMNNTPLIEEDFQAWRYGPVIPQVYQTCKIYGSSLIKDLTIFELFVEDKYINDKAYNVISESGKKTIDLTWNALKKVDAINLSNWTHIDGSPWQLVYEAGSNHIISKESIKTYFLQFLKSQK